MENLLRWAQRECMGLHRRNPTIDGAVTTLQVEEVGETEELGGIHAYGGALGYGSGASGTGQQSVAKV